MVAGEGRGGALARGELAQCPVLTVLEHHVYLVSAQHLRQHAPGLGRAELRPRVGGQPAPAVRIGGEGTGRRAATGQRGAGCTTLVLVRQSAPERGQVKRARVPHAAPPGVLKKRLDIALIGPDRVARQGTFGGKVPTELSQRRAQRLGQAAKITRCNTLILM